MSVDINSIFAVDDLPVGTEFYYSEYSDDIKDRFKKKGIDSYVMVNGNLPWVKSGFLAGKNYKIFSLPPAVAFNDIPVGARFILDANLGLQNYVLTKLDASTSILSSGSKITSHSLGNCFYIIDNPTAPPRTAAVKVGDTVSFKDIPIGATYHYKFGGAEILTKVDADLAVCKGYKYKAADHAADSYVIDTLPTTAGDTQVVRTRVFKYSLADGASLRVEADGRVMYTTRFGDSRICGTLPIVNGFNYVVEGDTIIRIHVDGSKTVKTHNPKARLYGGLTLTIPEDQKLVEGKMRCSINVEGSLIFEKETSPGSDIWRPDLISEFVPSIVSKNDYTAFYRNGLLHSETRAAKYDTKTGKSFYYLDGNQYPSYNAMKVAAGKATVEDWIASDGTNLSTYKFLDSNEISTVLSGTGLYHNPDGPAYTQGRNLSYYLNNIPLTKAYFDEAKEFGIEPIRDGEVKKITWVKRGTKIKHRIKGPAVGTKYYLNDVEISKEVHASVVNQNLIVSKNPSTLSVDIHNEDGRLHNFDGPAVINVDGSVEYHILGVPVKEDIFKGIQKDYKRGIVPVVEKLGGLTTLTYKNANGQTHREEGPALIYADNYLIWRRNDLTHREDGPAIIKNNGTESYHLSGVMYEKSVWEVKVAAIKKANDAKTLKDFIAAMAEEDAIQAPAPTAVLPTKPDALRFEVRLDGLPFIEIMQPTLSVNPFPPPKDDFLDTLLQDKGQPKAKINKVNVREKSSEKPIIKKIEPKPEFKKVEPKKELPVERIAPKKDEMGLGGVVGLMFAGSLVAGILGKKKLKKQKTKVEQKAEQVEHVRV